MEDQSAPNNDSSFEVVGYSKDYEEVAALSGRALGAASGEKQGRSKRHESGSSKSSLKDMPALRKFADSSSSTAQREVKDSSSSSQLLRDSSSSRQHLKVPSRRTSKSPTRPTSSKPRRHTSARSSSARDGASSFKKPRSSTSKSPPRNSSLSLIPSSRKPSIAARSYSAGSKKTARQVSISEENEQSISLHMDDSSGFFRGESISQREDDDVKYLRRMFAQSDTVVNYGDDSSKSSLKLAASEYDSSDNNQNDTQQQQRRPSLLDKLKGMHSSYPRRSPRKAMNDSRKYTTRAISNSLMMSSSSSNHMMMMMGGNSSSHHSRRGSNNSSGGGSGRRRSSLLQHMQHIFQGVDDSDDDAAAFGGADMEDLVVNEDDKEIGVKTTSGDARSSPPPPFCKTTGEQGPCRFLLSVLVVFAAVVGLAVLVSEIADSNQLETTIGDINTPTILNVSKVPQTSRRHALTYLIRDQGISSNRDLLTAMRYQAPVSAAALALKWIADMDPAKLPIPGFADDHHHVNDNDDDHNSLLSLYAVFQRYGLAVLYFSNNKTVTTSTNDEQSNTKITANNNWMTKTPICQWQGISCNEDDSLVVAINLTNSGWQGRLPPEILFRGAFPALTSVDLSHNQFSARLPYIYHHRRPSELGINTNRIPLKELHLNDNLFTGWISTLFILEDLALLDLSDNNFDGAIPSSIMLLSHLSSLNVKNNQMSGKLPSFKGWTKLESLHLEDNQFTGRIPSDWSSLTSLTTLNLGHNEELIGELPSFLGVELTKLRTLNFRETGLNGTIPTALSQLTDLENLHLHSTSLSGAMPEEICQLRPPNGGLERLTADCNDEIGTVACDCCTECFGGH